jgi:hypothetical protein
MVDVQLPPFAVTEKQGCLVTRAPKCLSPALGPCINLVFRGWCALSLAQVALTSR